MPRRSVPAALAAVLALSLLAGCRGGASPSATPSATSTPSPSPASEIDQAVAATREYVNAYADLFTGATVLVRVGDQSRVISVGRAAKRPSRPMTADQKFPIFGLSQVQTAAIVMRLVQDGRVSLRDPIEKYLPGLLPEGRHITIAELLSRFSGLSDPNWSTLPDDVTTDEFIAASARQPMLDAPGAGFHFTETDYLVLESLIAEVTGLPADTAYQRMLFTPAGMTHTHFGGGIGVDGHRNGGPDLGLRYPDLGASSMVSTVTDMDAFFTYLLSGHLLDEDQLEVMLRRRTYAPSTRGLNLVGVGYQVMTTHQQCGTFFGSESVNDAWTASAWTTRDNRRSAVVFINDGYSADLALEIANAAICA